VSLQVHAHVTRAAMHSSILFLGVLVSSGSWAACDEQSLIGSWQLQGNGQSLAQGETCVGSAELEFLSGGNASFQNIEVSCQQDPGLPDGTTLSGRYSIRPGCHGEMDVGGKAWFVVVNDGQELLLIRGQGAVTMSWTGEKKPAAQAGAQGPEP